jgi:hypothetical protein
MVENLGNLLVLIESSGCGSGGLVTSVDSLNPEHRRTSECRMDGPRMDSDSNHQ